MPYFALIIMFYHVNIACYHLYNSLLKLCALDGDPVDHESTRSTHLIDKPFDPMLLLRPHHLHLKLRVELSSTR